MKERKNHQKRKMYPQRGTAARVLEAGEKVGLKNTETDLVGPFRIQTLDIDNPPLSYSST
jgi:hypothetical protein